MTRKIATTTFRRDYTNSHFETVVAIAMDDGNCHRTPFLQKFESVLSTGEVSKTFWVADGFYNKKQYKSYKTAWRAFCQAVGELVIEGYTQAEFRDTFTSRFKN